MNRYSVLFTFANGRGRPSQRTYEVKANGSEEAYKIARHKLDKSAPDASKVNASIMPLDQPPMDAKASIRVQDAVDVTPIPWFVNFTPPYYDDGETFNWEGMATSEDEAIKAALVDCQKHNERTANDYLNADELAHDLDPANATVNVAEPDFKAICAAFIYQTDLADSRADTIKIMRLALAVAKMPPKPLPRVPVAQTDDADDDSDTCSECGAALDDGEGFDGLCGTCADHSTEEDN